MEFASADEYSFDPSHGRFQGVFERPDCLGEGVGDGPREASPDWAIQ
jgi:hypothetical protein